jgi:hypothetical protein
MPTSFRFIYVVKPWGLEQAPERLEVGSASFGRVKLVLRHIREDELKPHYDRRDWVAELYTEEPVSDELRGQLMSSKEARSPAIVELYRCVSLRLRDFLESFLRVSRWRIGIYGDHRLISGNEGQLCWSDDNMSWRPVPTYLTMSTSVEVVSKAFSQQSFDAITSLVETGAEEPTGHELLREAWNLQHASPRSALIMALSAVEVGTKELVAELVPQAEWLCFEVPFPPVVKLLEEYLPTLPVRRRLDGKVFVPDVAIRTLRKAVTERNRVAHRGTAIGIRGLVEDTLRTVQSVLCLLDYYAGHEWALENIRDPQVLANLTGSRA